jgi:hypothetical protein
MSRRLPARPNLEHLKKQARSRLPALQRHDASAQLADALHATAREYGFSSWPALKQLVESVRPGSGQSPLAGVWRINPDESPEPLLRLCDAVSLELAVGGDRVTLSEVMREQSGAETRRSYTLRIGGPPQQVEHGYRMTARLEADRVLTVSVGRNDEHLMHVTYAVSDDGRTLTLTAAAAAHAGYPSVEQIIRFDRAADST